MINKTLLFSVCLLFVACIPKRKESLPANILPVYQMAKLMVDIQLFESSTNTNIAPADTLKNKQNTPFVEILKKHHITAKRYNENFDYYTVHLDSLDKVYELVLIDLSKMKAEVMNEKEPVKDTLQEKSTVK